MARNVDALVTFFRREDDDEYRKRMTATDLIVDFELHETISLGNTATKQIPLTNLHGTTYTKLAIFLETDKHVKLQALTRNGASSDLTTKVGYGQDIAGGGFFFNYSSNTTATPTLWITNQTTDTAIIKYWIFAVTASV